MSLTVRVGGASKIMAQKAMDEMITKQRLKEFYKRLHARPTTCRACAGSGHTDGHKDEKCKGCTGTGVDERKLAVIADTMLRAGATDADLVEWLGPLLEPERQLGVIRHGGRVNIEMGPQGMIMEGLVSQMDVVQNTESIDVTTFSSVQQIGIPGRRTCEVSLSISEYDFSSPRESPGDRFLEEHPPVAEQVVEVGPAISTGRWLRSYAMPTQPVAPQRVDKSECRNCEHDLHVGRRCGFRSHGGSSTGSGCGCEG